MSLLLLSILPGILICLFIYFRDHKSNREPVGLLLLCFFLGVAIAVPCIFLETWLSKTASIYLRALGATPVIHIIVQSFAVIALCEEGLKFLVLKKIAFPLKKFDEPMDGIVYSVFVSMGFATIENVGYVYMHGATTAIMRMFLSVPAHAAFAVLMGYYVGMAKFNLLNRRKLLLKGLFIAILFHGLYDTCLFLAETKSVTQYISGGLLITGALFSYYVAVKLSLRAIRQQSKLSKIIHDQPAQLRPVDS
jgi:RsiW-degrading membrane proteinase PrsW (M82 family)